jgi:hypothetical protein
MTVPAAAEYCSQYHDVPVCVPSQSMYVPDRLKMDKLTEPVGSMPHAG